MAFAWRVVGWGVLALTVSSGMPPARADEAEEAAHAATAVGPRVGPLRASSHAGAPWPAIAPTRHGDAAWRIGIVELPANGAWPGPQRPHHAISIASESPRRLLRSIGFDASECSTRLRLPTKLKQLGGGVQAQVQGQLLFACRF
jgi:hypothetical protein